mmetsp:Transcript_16659/g.22320  ORF Transcript_16659/g.22320 Transcript_16659/m.22320 type:complete len:126 (-) Transcript_16659:523-900(-)
MNQQLEIFTKNIMAAIENSLAGNASSCITISNNSDEMHGLLLYTSVVSRITLCAKFAAKTVAHMPYSFSLDSQDLPVAINGAVLIQHIQKCRSLLQSSVKSWACLEISNRPKKAESCIQICSPAA